MKAEGIYGLYKGVFAHYLRTGPHTVHSPSTMQSSCNSMHQCWPNLLLLVQILTFVFWEQYKKLASNL